MVLWLPEAQRYAGTAACVGCLMTYPPNGGFILLCSFIAWLCLLDIDTLLAKFATDEMSEYPTLEDCVGSWQSGLEKDVFPYGDPMLNFTEAEFRFLADYYNVS